MNIVDFLILGLACWRLSKLITSEEGPFHVFHRIRELTGITHDVDGNIFKIPDRVMAGIFSCVWCASIWIGFGLTALWFFEPRWTVLGATPFAISAGAILVEKVTGAQ